MAGHRRQAIAGSQPCSGQPFYPLLYPNAGAGPARSPLEVPEERDNCPYANCTAESPRPLPVALACFALADGDWRRAASGEWRVASGERRAASGERRTIIVVGATLASPAAAAAIAPQGDSGAPSTRLLATGPDDEGGRPVRESWRCWNPEIGGDATDRPRQAINIDRNGLGRIRTGHGRSMPRGRPAHCSAHNPWSRVHRIRRRPVAR